MPGEDDVTALERELTEARRQYEQFRDWVPGALAEIDLADYRVRHLNQIAQRLLGYAASDVAGGLPAADLFDGETREALRQSIESFAAASRRTGEPYRRDREQYLVEGTMVRKDGSTFPFEGQSAFVLDENDVPAGLWFHFRDISSRRVAQRRAMEAQKRESLGLMAGGIAQRINNLLVGILGNAQIVLDNPDATPPIHEAIEDLVGSAQEVAELTRHVLAYAGDTPPANEIVDVNTVIDRLYPLLQTLVPERVQLAWRPGQGPPPVHGDRAQLSQVVTNLVLNAIEACEENRGGRVEVRTSASDGSAAGLEGAQAGPGVLVDVTDTGSGMGATVQASMFDPFFSTRMPGRGLGLAAVQGIVRSHGGAITVDSTAGRGTTMRVWLPAAERDAK